MLIALLIGCTTPCHEESFASTFDAAKVAQLSHQCYQVAWDADYWVRVDLYYASFHVRRTDRETVFYLYRLKTQVPWIALEIEKHPDNPRCASKQAYDIAAFNAKMLKVRYQPSSFQPATDAKIQKALNLFDQISSYYEMKEGLRTERITKQQEAGGNQRGTDLLQRQEEKRREGKPTTKHTALSPRSGRILAEIPFRGSLCHQNV